MDDKILSVFRILEETKAIIRSEGCFDNLTPDKRQAIELLDKIHDRIVKEVVLK